MNEPSVKISSYPLGMCFQDRTNTPSPVIRTGNSISGFKIKGCLDIWKTPVVDVIVGNGTYYANLKAKIDTGAYHNHINSKIAEQLKSVPRATETHNTPYGPFDLSIYALVMGFQDFPDTQFVCDMRSVDFNDVDVLIGTQFLIQFCDFHYYGGEQRFELVFR
jgi:hypothetical protein